MDPAMSGKSVYQRDNIEQCYNTKDKLAHCTHYLALNFDGFMQQKNIDCAVISSQSLVIADCSIREYLVNIYKYCCQILEIL